MVTKNSPSTPQKRPLDVGSRFVMWSMSFCTPKKWSGVLSKGNAVWQGWLILHLRETGGERAYLLSLARSVYQSYSASIRLAYLGSGIVRRTPPITSCGLKSVFGLFGCAL